MRIVDCFALDSLRYSWNLFRISTINPIYKRNNLYFLPFKRNLIFLIKSNEKVKFIMSSPKETRKIYKWFKKLQKTVIKNG